MTLDFLIQLIKPSSRLVPKLHDNLQKTVDVKRATFWVSNESVTISSRKDILIQAALTLL